MKKTTRRQFIAALTAGFVFLQSAAGVAPAAAFASDLPEEAAVTEGSISVETVFDAAEDETEAFNEFNEPASSDEFNASDEPALSDEFNETGDMSAPNEFSALDVSGEFNGMDSSDAFEDTGASDEPGASTSSDEFNASNEPSSSDEFYTAADPASFDEFYETTEPASTDDFYDLDATDFSDLIEEPAEDLPEDAVFADVPETEVWTEFDPAVSKDEEVLPAEEEATESDDADAADDELPFYESGTCGDDLTWVLEADTDIMKKTLTISGTGAMTDYESAVKAPWYAWAPGISQIIIEEGVTRIGNYAFAGSYYRNFDLPESLERIGNYAFSGDKLLTSLTFKTGPINIGDYAFMNSGLTELMIPPIPEKYEGRYHMVIGNGAFSGCASLTQITLPEDGVGFIYDEAFANCSSLETLELPKLGYIATGLCKNCTSLRSVITKIKDQYGYNEVEFIINTDAFRGCSGLKEITIPGKTWTIATEAFTGCDALEDVYYGSDRMDWNYCGGAANTELSQATVHFTFSNTGDPCSGTCGDDLTWEVTGEKPELTLTIRGSGPMAEFPVTITHRQKNAALPWDEPAEDITKVVVEDGVTTISAYAFQDFLSVREIILPDSITSIGDAAFTGCRSLPAIDLPDGLTEIASQAFAGCKSLQEIDLPDGLTEIASQMFMGCTSMQEIELPAKVTEIGMYAFAGCSGLGSVLLPQGLLTIGNYSFQGCSALESIDLPDGLQRINGYAFKNAGLTQIVVPDTVTDIGTDAFSGCTQLASVTIPKGLTGISERLFERCKALEQIEIPADVTYIGWAAFWGCSSLRKITILGNKITEIQRYAFEECSSLSFIHLPCSAADTINILKNQKGTHSLNDYCELELVHSRDEGTCIVEPDCTSDGKMEYRCPGCGITMTEKVPKLGHSFTDYRTYPDKGVIGAYCDHGCGEFDVKETLETVGSGTGEDGLTWTVYSSGMLYISGDGEMQDYSEENPAPWSGMPYTECIIDEGVTFIGANAFADSGSLMKVQVPASVSDINLSAFNGCENLTAIDIGPANTVLCSQDGVVYTANRQNLCLCPAGKSGSFTVPEGTLHIIEGAFENCAKLTQILLPEGLLSLGADSLKGTAITQITIPSSLTYVDPTVLSGCPSLDTINVEDGNTNYSSEDGILYSVSKISVCLVPPAKTGTISLGKQVERICSGAFANCAGVDRIELEEEDTGITFEEEAFRDTADPLVVSVPYSMKSITDLGHLESNVIIEGYENSAAKYFAEDEGLTFSSLGLYPTAWDETDEHRFLAFQQLRRKILDEYEGYYRRTKVKTDLAEIYITIKEFNGSLNFSYIKEMATEQWDLEFSIKDGIVEENRFCYSDTFTAAADMSASGDAYILPETLTTNTEKTYNYDFSFDAGRYYSFTAAQFKESANTSLYAALLTFETDLLMYFDIRLRDLCFTNYGNYDGIHIPVKEGGVEPTCTEDGRTDRITCRICGALQQESEIIPATGHTVVTDPMIEPGCDLPGVTAGSHCLVCNEVLVAPTVIPPRGHSEVEDPAVEPDCENEGKTAGSHCNVCGKVLKEQEKIAATGHSEIETIPGRPATETQTGLTEGQRCKKCGKIITAQKEIPKLTPQGSQGSSSGTENGGSSGSSGGASAGTNSGASSGANGGTSAGTSGGSSAGTGTAAGTGAAKTPGSSAGSPGTSGKTGSNGEKSTGNGSTGAGTAAAADAPGSVAAQEQAILNISGDEAPSGSDFSKIQLRYKKAAKNKIVLTWKAVGGADGYIIYGANCGSKNQKIDEVHTTSFTHGGLKKGTYYKYMVVAYRNDNGAQKVIGTSKTVHVATSGGKVGNYKKITVKKKKVTLKKKKTFKIKAKAVAASKKLKVKKHRKLLYESSNTAVATVTASGKIKAVGKGTCDIFVYAQDGKFAKVRVKVK